MASDVDLERVHQLIQTDPVARQWSERILVEARRAESEPPIRYDPSKGIEVARELQRRVTHLAIAYRLTGEQRFFDAARRDLLAAAAFGEWSQPSFLATAEMTTSVAIGYDWLFSRLSPDDRQQIRSAIVNKGLRVGMEAYESRASWVEARHNWNLVCNSGMIVGALSVLDEDPDLAKLVFALARASIEHGLAGYAPDGGWEEGPTYWNYGTRYLALAVASMRSTTGSMQGIDQFPGVARTGEFRIHTIGPTGLNFNFADASEAPGDSPQMFALAWAFKRPEYAQFERRRSQTDPSVFDLLWFQPESPSTATLLPTAALFRGIDVASFRGDWNDPNTTWVAMKGGSNRAHHGHLDLGTFVLDALGQRWAINLGSDSYDLPGSMRWTYYRYATAGHNTVSVNSANQLETATAPLIAYQSTPARSDAVVDLTAAFGGDAKLLLRGVALLNRRDVLVQDEIRLRSSEVVAWSMHTRAAVEVHGRTAVLRQGGKTLTARLLYPPGAEFSVEPATAPPPQNPNTGVSRLMIRFRPIEPTHIAVLFTPGALDPEIPRLQPVSSWRDDAGLARTAAGKR